MSGQRGERGRQRLGPGDRFVVGLAGALGPVLLRLLGATWRVRFVNARAVDAARAGGRPFLYAFWHESILPVGYAHRGSGVAVLSSWHKDGEISTRIMLALGYIVERGSTTRGSVHGLMKMVKRAREGCDLGVTPDGPKGPARVAQRGTPYLAVKVGGPVLPLAVGVDRFRRLSSWDGFVVPYPFARIVILYGDPIEIARDADLDAAAISLTDTLERLGERARALVRDDASGDTPSPGSDERTEACSGD